MSDQEQNPNITVRKRLSWELFPAQRKEIISAVLADPKYAVVIQNYREVYSTAMDDKAAKTKAWRQVKDALENYEYVIDGKPYGMDIALRDDLQKAIKSEIIEEISLKDPVTRVIHSLSIRKVAIPYCEAHARGDKAIAAALWLDVERALKKHQVRLNGEVVAESAALVALATKKLKENPEEYLPENAVAVPAANISTAAGMWGALVSSGPAEKEPDSEPAAPVNETPTTPVNETAAPKAEATAPVSESWTTLVAQPTKQQEKQARLERAGHGRALKETREKTGGNAGLTDISTALPRTISLLPDDLRKKSGATPKKSRG